MANKSFECYLCGESAKQYDSPDTSRRKIVECTHCINRYRVTDRAIKFLLEELDEQDRYKVHELVYGKIIDLNIDDIVHITGRKSHKY